MRTFLMEIKDGKKAPSRRALTPDEFKWHADWRGYPVAVVESLEQAIKVVNGKGPLD